MKSGITAETLTRIERLQRAMSASTFRKLATTLEIPPADDRVIHATGAVATYAFNPIPRP